MFCMIFIFDGFYVTSIAIKLGRTVVSLNRLNVAHEISRINSLVKKILIKSCIEIYIEIYITIDIKIGEIYSVKNIWCNVTMKNLYIHKTHSNEFNWKKIEKFHIALRLVPLISSCECYNSNCKHQWGWIRWDLRIPQNRLLASECIIIIM